MAKAVTVAITAPTSKASPPLVSSDTSRCTGFGGWYAGVGSRITGTATWRGFVTVPRDVFGVALAVLRQPVSARATIASPAMIAARMVRSLTDTRPQTLVMPPPQPSAVAPPARPRPPRREGRYWAVPLVAIAIVILVGIVIAALLPAQLVAHKDVDRNGTAVSEETPFAIVPASVQPVADRVSYRDLGADVAVDL